MPAVPWGEFARAEPELAAFGACRLGVPVAYLATLRADGRPRVHPVTPIVTDDALYLFMEPASPKGRDLRERRRFALHTGVPDTQGTGGEFWITGDGVAVDDPAARSVASAAASYDVSDDYVLYELRLTEARCNGYGDVPLPERRRWSTGTPG